MKLAIRTSTSPRSFAALLVLSLGFGLCLSCSADTAETPSNTTSGGNTSTGGTTSGGSGGTASGGGGAGGTASGGGGAGGTASGGGGAGGTASGGGGAGGTASGGGGAGGTANGGGGAGGTANGGGGAGGTANGGGGAGGGGAGGDGGGGAGGQVNASEDCQTVCGGIVDRCPMFEYYPSMNDCLTDCTANEADMWDMMCRKMHLMALPADNDTTHCPHIAGENTCD
jgi:hypothetical protein